MKVIWMIVFLFFFFAQLFHFDVHEDVRTIADATIEKDEVCFFYNLFVVSTLIYGFFSIVTCLFVLFHILCWNNHAYFLSLFLNSPMPVKLLRGTGMKRINTSFLLQDGRCVLPLSLSIFTYPYAWFVSKHTFHILYRVCFMEPGSTCIPATNVVEPRGSFSDQFLPQVLIIFLCVCGRYMTRHRSGSVTPSMGIDRIAKHGCCNFSKVCLWKRNRKLFSSNAWAELLDLRTKQRYQVGYLILQCCSVHFK